MLEAAVLPVQVVVGQLMPNNTHPRRLVNRREHAGIKFQVHIPWKKPPASGAQTAVKHRLIRKRTTKVACAHLFD